MKKYYFLCLIAGVLHALGYPSEILEGIALAPVLGFFLLFYSLQQSASLKKKFFLSFLFSLGHTMTGYYWIGETLHVFGELPKFISYSLNAFFTILSLPHLWVITPVFHFFQKRKISPLLLALIITLIEYFFPQQFPTLLGQNALVFAPYLGLAPYFGIPIFSFYSYWLILHFLNRKYRKSLYQNILFTLSFCLFILSNALMPLKKDSQGYLKTRVIQASIDNDMKRASEAGSNFSFTTVVKRYKDLSLEKSQTPLDLIVWPETAYPYSISLKEMQSSFRLKTPLPIQEVLFQSSSHLLIGGYDTHLKNPEDVSNSAFLFSPEPQPKDVYHKRKLIPFGETLPFGPLTEYIKPYFSNIAFFKRGTRWTQFSVNAQKGEKAKFITPICYEVLSPEFIRNYLNAAPSTDFIINLTNDSWYGNTAEPFQHLFLAKWRAIEFQIPLLRSTNNGITSLIYPDGSESKRLHYNEIKKLDLRIPLNSPGKRKIGAYQRWGILPTLGLMIFLLLVSQGVVFFNARRTRSALLLSFYRFP